MYSCLFNTFSNDVLLPAPLESTKEKNGTHSLPQDSCTSSLEATESAQATSTGENCTSKPVQSISTDESCASKPFPRISTSETPKENTFFSHKGCNATVEESLHTEKGDKGKVCFIFLPP